MERRERWLGYVAVGLGALALLAALNGGSTSYITVEAPRAVSVPQGAPAPTAVPPQQLMPAQPPLPVQPPPFFWREHGARPHIEEHFQYHWRGGPGSGWGWPFGGLFASGQHVASTLLRFAVAFFLLMLGLRLLRGGRRGNPPAGNSGGEAPPTPMSGPPAPPANRPPSMGETTYL